MRLKGVGRVASFRMAVAAALALAAFPAVHAAELPSRAKPAKPAEGAQAQKKCNIAGVPGVLAANGVCVKLSGSITAGFGGQFH